jgi:RNA polymerase sigma-70 factor (sigma-E family)
MTTTTRDEQFRAFVAAGRPQLLRTATLLTAGDQHLAEDLVQTVLTKLYVAWPAYQRAGNREGYVRRMLANALVDEHRRPWRRELRVAEVPEAAAAEHTEAGPVLDALRGLPPGMRAVLVFRFLHDLTVADTAAALGLSEGTVKSQTSKALDHLRRALGPAALSPATTRSPR